MKSDADISLILEHALTVADKVMVESSQRMTNNNNLQSEKSKQTSLVTSILSNETHSIQFVIESPSLYPSIKVNHFLFLPYIYLLNIFFSGDIKI